MGEGLFGGEPPGFVGRALNNAWEGSFGVRAVSMEEHLKHLDIIQATVARLASNSFALRGWSVTLVAGLFALAAKDSDPKLAVISYLPVLAFWMLDGYYLFQERRFRSLFDRVAAREAAVPPFSLDPDVLGKQRLGWAAACFSGPLLVFHGALLLTVTIVSVLFY